MPSQALLDELKTIIEEDYGVMLEPHDLLEMGRTLVDFYEILSEKNKKNENI